MDTVIKTRTNPYIDVKPNVQHLEISAKDILYETVDARAASQQNITWDLDAKGDDSLLCSNAYVTAHFRIRRKTSAVQAGNINVASIMQARDRLCLRNNFYEEMQLNTTVNFQGVNINSRPYIACKELGYIFEDQEYQRKYGGTGGGFTNLSDLNDDNYKLEPVRGQLLRKSGDHDANPTWNSFTSEAVNNYDSANGQIVVDNNNYDAERMSKINWFRDTVENGKVVDTTYKEFSVTFPLKAAPFKGHRRGMFYDSMSDCIPYVKNSSINMQLKQGINGIALEQFFVDKLNRTGGSATAGPNFASSLDLRGSEYEVIVDPVKQWNLHLRWFQSPVPLAEVYNIKTFRLDHYLKQVTQPIAANVVRDIGKTVNSDLIRVGSKPEYLLIYCGENVLGPGRGNDVNFANNEGADANEFKPGYLKSANIEIAGIDLQISNQQGVLTSSMNADALKFYTKENVCREFSAGYDMFHKFRNFIFLKTSDLAAPNGPAGVLQNCNIKVSAKLRHYDYNTTNDGANLTAPDYNLNVCLVYTHTKIQISDRGVRLMDQDTNPQAYDQLVVRNVNEFASMKPAGHISSYKSNF